MMCGFALTEATVLILHRVPYPFSARLLSLIPGNASATHPSTLSLSPLSATGCALAIVGGLLRVKCHRALGRFFTWDLTIKPNQYIVNTGPYAIVRHPSYVGSVLISVGSMMVHFGEGSWFAAYGGLESWTGRALAAAWTAWSLGVSLMLMWRVGQEEDVLHAKFGKEWEEWAERVPYRLYPFIW